jgi:hypothetical protein
MSALNIDGLTDTPTGSNYVWDGTVWDRMRGDRTFPASSSSGGISNSSRTATTQTAIALRNHGAKTVIIFLNVAAASGTGGISVVLQCQSPGGTIVDLVVFTGVTATGTYVYEYGSGVAGSPHAGITGSQAGALPRDLRVQIRHANSTAYTYSVEWEINT